MSAGVSLSALQARALLNHNLRDFFRERKVLEVETQALSARYESPLVVMQDQQKLYLQPNHSRAMQDLISAGSGAIYQIAKAFCSKSLDRRHQREFTLLQWSQPDWQPDQVIEDVTSLFGAIFAGDVLPEIRSYAAAFYQRLGFDPSLLTANELRLQARRLGLSPLLGDDRIAWMDLLFSHFIEPTLGIEAPLYLSELVVELVDTDQMLLGQPFVEIYMEGIKVGSILQHVAIVEPITRYSIVLGLDRLLMVMMETRRISQVYGLLESADLKGHDC